MAYSANRYENMLREFIIEQQSDSYNRGNINYQRYNNLKIYMMPSKNKNPHIWIRIGISEACFLIEDGSTIVGSIGRDQKFIPKWLNKSGIREELMETWVQANKVTSEEEDKAQ
ncbi:hypothetical protein IKE67_09710 [bacterium]|nr:hypothetical protein [bacterium]